MNIFYTNQMRNEGGLDPLNAFFEKMYGRWQAMLAEGLVLIGYMAAAIYFGFIQPLDKTEFVLLFIRALGVLGLVFGCVYLLLNRRMSRKDYYRGWLGGRGWFELIAGAVALVFPSMFMMMITGIIGFASFVIGMSLAFSRGGQGAGRFFRRLTGLALIILGAALSFMPYTTFSWFAGMIAGLLGLLGCYLVYASFGLKKAVRKIKMDRDGFTDYTVE